MWYFTVCTTVLYCACYVCFVRLASPWLSEASVRTLLQCPCVWLNTSQQRCTIFTTPHDGATEQNSSSMYLDTRRSVRIYWSTNKHTILNNTLDPTRRQHRNEQILCGHRFVCQFRHARGRRVVEAKRKYFRVTY